MFLEIAIFDLKLSAQAAPDSECFIASVGGMLQIQRAIVLSLALVPWRTFPIMAMHAVVVDATTVIGRYVTAKIALKLNVGLFVLLAVGYAEFVIRFLAEEFAFRALLLIVC